MAVSFILLHVIAADEEAEMVFVEFSVPIIPIYEADAATFEVSVDQLDEFLGAVWISARRIHNLLDDTCVHIGNWDWVRCFLGECERLSGGVRPLLYTGPVAGTIPQDIRDRYGLWIAQYANMSPTGYQANPWMIGAYGEAMRQYSGTGVVNTWSPIDLNLFRGDAWQWDLYANPTGGSTPPATPAAPAQPSDPQPTPSTGGISHTMQWGETIWGLAVAYNAWPLSMWHTPSGNINVYYVGDVVTCR